MKKRKAIVHIGTEKTGTSTVQRLLAGNRAVLANYGMHYPHALGPVNHIGLCALALDSPPQYDTVPLLLGAGRRPWAEVTAELARSFEAEFETLAPNITHVVFSNQHLHSNLVQHSEIARLAAFLGRYFDQTRIVVYLRRQDQVAHSLYSARIKGGGRLDQPVLPDVSRGLPHYFDYDTLLKKYETVFGAANITVRLFEPAHFEGGSFLADFCKASRLPGIAAFEDFGAQNESLSRAALALLAELNILVPPFRNGRWNPVRNNLVETLEKHFPGNDALVSRAEAEAFCQAFATSNERVRMRYFPELDGSLFATTFQHYPEHLDPVAPTLEQLGPIMAALWTARSGELSELRAALKLAHARNDANRVDNLARSGHPPADVERAYLDALARYPDAVILLGAFGRWLANQPGRELDALKHLRQAAGAQDAEGEYTALIAQLTRKASKAH